MSTRVPGSACPFPLGSLLAFYFMVYLLEVAPARGCHWEQVSGREQVDWMRLCTFTDEVGGELLSGLRVGVRGRLGFVFLSIHTS